jgi:hypothetical protein
MTHHLIRCSAMPMAGIGGDNDRVASSYFFDLIAI